MFWLIITTTKPPYSEPLKDLVNCTVTEISRIVCVCPCVMDVTHFRNVYSGNEATRFTITRTLGTSLLTDVAVSFIAPWPQLQEGYEGGTVWPGILQCIHICPACRDLDNRPYLHKGITINNYVNCPLNFTFAHSICLFHPLIFEKILM